MFLEKKTIFPFLWYYDEYSFIYHEMCFNNRLRVHLTPLFSVVEI
jgi:hypothetical protein